MPSSPPITVVASELVDQENSKEEIEEVEVVTAPLVAPVLVPSVNRMSIEYMTR